MDDISIRKYAVPWTDTDNTIIALYSHDRWVGTVEVAVSNTGDRKGEALIWNLHVLEPLRGFGYGRRLLAEAEETARLSGCHTTVMEWDGKDSPRWVLDWYFRRGYDEKEFGRDCALLKKTINNNNQ